MTLRSISICAAVLNAVALLAQPAAQPSYPTPRAAVTALVKAVQVGSLEEIGKIIGPELSSLVEASPEQRRIDQTMFLAAAKEGVKIEADPDKPERMIAYFGDLEWPFPAPLVKSGNKWYFDSVAGKEEAMDRAIGRHELAAIATCAEFVDAQLDYASTDHDGDGILEFAQKLISSPGKHDGLYWNNDADGDLSPLGPYFARAAAAAEKSLSQGEKPEPLAGYYFKLLTRQGSNARGGAKDFVTGGHLLGGFGLVAWPAEYGKSGVSTFIVNQLGQIYEKDLGAGSAAAAQAMTSFDPDSSWKLVKLDN